MRSEDVSSTSNTTKSALNLVSYKVLKSLSRTNSYCTIRINYAYDFSLQYFPNNLRQGI